MKEYTCHCEAGSINLNGSMEDMLHVCHGINGYLTSYDSDTEKLDLYINQFDYLEEDLGMPEHAEMCDSCGRWIVPEVLKSQAGYYIGLFHHGADCVDSGPWSRFTEYFETENAASEALAGGNYKTRRF